MPNASNKFPFINQLDSNDCGLACIRMIARYYGKEFSSQDLNECSNLSNQGISLSNLSKSAEKIGFRSLYLLSDFDKLVKEIPLPAIAHWNQNHYVVVYKIKKDLVYVADPAFGLATYKKEEFLKAWADSHSRNMEEGVLLLLETTPEFQNQASSGETNRATFSFLLRYLRYFKIHLLSLATGLFLSSVMELIFPFFTQVIVDRGIGQQQINFIYLVLIAQVVLFISKTSIDFLRERIFMHISSRISVYIISDFLIKLMKLPLSFFNSRQIGDITQRINDHSRIEKFMTETLLKSIFAILTLVVLSGILIYFKPLVFVIFLSFSLVELTWIFAFLKKIRTLENKSFALLAQDMNKVYELITGMQEIKLNNLEQKKRWEWERIQAALFKINLSKLKLNQTYSSYRIFTYLQQVLIIFVTALAVLHHEMTIGTMMAVIFILGQLNEPISQLINFVLQAQYAKISLQRLSEVHMKENEEDSAGLKILQLPVNKDIQLKHLTFSYTESPGQEVLSDINLNIPAGKTTAIVGVSGSGKTTLLKLLLKFYPTEKGGIRVGDHNLDFYNTAFWRSCCGTVLQDSFLFSDTIAGNIALSDQMDVQRLRHAAETARVHDFIVSLPMGYHTRIGQDGQGISQGQRQRLLIARVVYKNPDYLFFDEATNALDAENELIIMGNLQKFCRNKTVVIVAHRLSTVKHADQIVVMDKGRIVEQGSHEQLTSGRGKYYTLIKNQLELGN
jgi:ATP-binding cassette subfamily B protein